MTGTLPRATGEVGDIVVPVEVTANWPASIHEVVHGGNVVEREDQRAAAGVFAAAVLDRLHMAASRCDAQLVDEGRAREDLESAYRTLILARG